jgi:hypothetical protein
MSPDKETHEIVKGEDDMGKYIKLNNDGKIKIKDSLELDENIELVSYTKNLSNEEELSTFSNINVAIASSITAYARIIMSKIKTEYSNNIYYSDTDSIDLDIKLPDKYLSDNLGDYKLENIFKEVVYIAPKVYAAISDKKEEYLIIKGYQEDNLSLDLEINLSKKDRENPIEFQNILKDVVCLAPKVSTAITEKKEEYIIIKGYKDDNVNFNEIANIVNKNEKLILNQEKWYTDFSHGRITTKLQSYTLMATENKRKLVYENNKLIATIPYKLLNDELA